MTTYDPRRAEHAITRDDWPESRGAGTRRDRVRWGPIWAGAIVALPTFIVLQSLFFALGWLNLGVSGSGGGAAASIVSGILALAAFFVGGLISGATAIWGETTDGLLQGVMMWALTVVGILSFSLLGGGALLGPLGNVVAEVANLRQLFPQAPNFDPAQALRSARQAAGWGALSLGLSVVAAGVGGSVGSQLRTGRSGKIGAAR